jgi:hypothetical protein
MTDSTSLSEDRPATNSQGMHGGMRIAVPVAPLLGEPRAAASLTSQYLGGHRVEVLEKKGDWLRIRGGDAYEGWMHAGYLADASGPFDDAAQISLGCVVRGAGGHRRALPLGALLDAGDVLIDGDVVQAKQRESHFPGEGSAIAGSAIRFFEGTSYLWGGVTPWGADCSGLVQTIYALHGIPLPRDAGDQGRCGIDVPATADALLPGDLVFFSDRDDGKITHVAIAMGHARIVHLALGRGGYAIEALGGESDAYAVALRTRVRFARRVLGSAAG